MAPDLQTDDVAGYFSDLVGDFDADVYGSSQLGDAPPPLTQTQSGVYDTPPAPQRPVRDSAPADRWSYPSGYVRAQQRHRRGRRG